MDFTKQIISVRETSSIDSTGEVTAYIQTTYKLGDFGPFVLTTPREEFSAATVNQAIEAMRVELTGINA